MLWCQSTILRTMWTHQKPYSNTQTFKCNNVEDGTSENHTNVKLDIMKWLTSKFFSYFWRMCEVICHWFGVLGM